MSALQRDPEQVLRRLEWTALRRLDGLLQGDYRTLFRGFGLDLADLREYQYGDDVRHIDWNVTARLQTPYVREYHEDREITAWFLLDLSGSVDFGSGVDAVIPARNGRRHVVHILHRMIERHENSRNKTTDLRELLDAAAHVMRRRSLVFVVSDFFSVPGWAGLLGQLAQRHEVVAVRLHDPIEAELPDLGLLMFRD